MGPSSHSADKPEPSGRYTQHGMRLPNLQMLIYMLRVLAYKSVSYVRQLRHELTQMSIYTSAQNFLASLSR